MNPRIFHNGKVQLYAGDCMEVLRTMPENSIDAVCTDPPYHLTSIVKRFGAEDAAPCKIGKTGAYARASRGFMGKVWDGGDIAFRPELWAEVLRVLKPGGHMVCFGGTRTYHRMTCAIEDAGFEIRDAIMWHYGSGFPKSHDVSKGIDRARDDRKDILRVTSFVADSADQQGISRAQIDNYMGTSDMAGWWTSRLLHRCQCPNWDQWLALKDFIGFSDEMDAEVWRLNGRKGKPGEAWAEREVIGTNQNAGPKQGWQREYVGGKVERETGVPITAPATEAASQWQGHGTALKPATEIICLARKPLSESTVAANVLRWGTGALNIDGCRIETAENLNGGAYSSGQKRPEDASSYFTGTKAGEYAQPLGRWPANLCHDGSPEVLAGFPDSNSSEPRIPTGSRQRQSGFAMTDGNGGFGDSGSAARFFYTSKADADDRLNSKHPTVKPLDLMQWLVRLLCPKGATVLDPFAGTGTTGAAAFIEGRRCVLIEREAEYLADIERRMELLLSGPDERSRKLAKPESLEGLPLFALTKPVA